MSPEDTAQRWAMLRFAVVAELLASPPQRGELQQVLTKLAAKQWQTPTGERRHFGVSTIERWYYQALKSNQPAEALRRRIRSDVGAERVMSLELLGELQAQYRAYPSWSYRLHADNLAALVEERAALGPAPSYTTVRRRMKRRGWRKKRVARTRGQQRAQERLEVREVRSFEKEHAHALWHFDFHEAKRKVLMPNGRWLQPQCLCILDDFSRLCCHIQWYYEECTETLAHGLQQAFLKRGLPRAMLSDNGSAMIAAETQSAAAELSITHETTLPCSPYQNGKQESFWGQLEGRLMAMLSAVEPLRIELLNHATQAWAEQEYNRSRHDELGVSPLEKLLSGRDLSRPSAELARLRLHFTRSAKRIQRRSDGTISVAGLRFEIPNRMRHLEQLTVRYAQWDLSEIYIVDSRHNTKVLATLHPQDKHRNADGRRRALEATEPGEPEAPKEPLPPLMRKLLSQYAATGQPPAYVPHSPQSTEQDDA